MLEIALVLLVLSASVGAWLAWGHLKGKPPPKPSAHVHGALSGGALVLLYWQLVTHGISPSGVWGIVALSVAALGGALLSVLHYLDKRLPVLLICAHVLFAVAGVIVIFGALWGPPPGTMPENNRGAVPGVDFTLTDPGHSSQSPPRGTPISEHKPRL